VVVVVVVVVGALDGARPPEEILSLDARLKHSAPLCNPPRCSSHSLLTDGSGLKVGRYNRIAGGF
jgi:hypothetical protein